MRQGVLQIEVKSRAWDGACLVESDVPPPIDQEFTRQWYRSEASKLLEDRAAAERQWSLVAYSAGARVMAHLTTGLMHGRSDSNRNISQLAREFCESAEPELILMSSRLLDKAVKNIAQLQAPIVCLDDFSRMHEVQSKLAGGARVVLSTPSVLARWRHQSSHAHLAGPTRISVATPIFHPHYLHQWIQAVPGVNRVDLLPAKGTWEETLAHRVSQALAPAAQGKPISASFEHPVLDLVRLRAVETTAVQRDIAADLYSLVSKDLNIAGRFAPIIQVALSNESAGLRSFGRHADAAVTWMASVEPRLAAALEEPRSLQLAL